MKSDTKIDTRQGRFIKTDVWQDGQLTMISEAHHPYMPFRFLDINGVEKAIAMACRLRCATGMELGEPKRK